ncbi:sensor histidine kinase [Paenibacillus sp. GCM10027628]|uniref:sensor histidine kinase n=1 Tax=Paenibacillus sp. GCM10027628 TaxID=3273413 RepID=UPI00363667E1
MPSLRPFFNSLRFKLFGIIFIIVPLVAVLVVINIYSVQVVRNEVSQSNRNLLSLYVGQIDQNLQQVDNYLYNLSQLNTDLLDLEVTSQNHENDYNKAKLRLYNSISNEISYYKMIDLFFIYSETNQELIWNQNFGSGYEQRMEVKQAILQMLQGDKTKYNNTWWYYWRDDQTYYLFHLIKTGNVYVGAWVNAEKMIVPFNKIDFGKSGTALLATNQLEPMNHADFIQKTNIQLKAVPGEPYYLSGNHNQYLVMSEPSGVGNFNLVALIPDETILEKLPFVQRISSVISIAACVFLVIFLLMMRKVFLLPINRMVAAMRKLRDGHWESRLHLEPTSTEFEIMHETYTGLIAEIRDLKIHVYEEKLNAQREELKHLQLQINPHFFLNTLNIVYNLATVKEYALIQEMSKCLVAYFRFMFRSGSGYVTLRDELKHTANYLRIQQLRFPDSLTYRIEADDELLTCEIPPLVIQTMVENCIKHAVTLDEPVEVQVVVDKDMTDGTSALKITIRDNGPGFEPHILNDLQSNVELTNTEGEQVGLWNVKRRLRLLYAAQASIQFFNAVPKGAVVEIKIPITSEKKE